MDFVWSGRLGGLSIAVISEGSSRFNLLKVLKAPAEQVRQDAPIDDQGWMDLPFNYLHAAGPGFSLLIDAGFGDLDPAPGSPPEIMGGYQHTPGVEAGLNRIGVGAGDVTHVVITHMHGDHFPGVARRTDSGWSARYPNARILVGDADWKASPLRTMLAEHMSAQMPAVEHQVDLVDSEREVVPGVVVVPTPGETAGHISVRVQSGGAILYHLGDVLHTTAELAHPDWIFGSGDPRTIMSTRARMVERALAEGALVSATHLPFPAMGRLERAGEGTRWIPAAPPGEVIST